MWSVDPKRRPKFSDLVPQVAAVRGAVAVTADGRLTVNTYDELVPFVGVVARDSDLIKHENARVGRLLAELGVIDEIGGSTLTVLPSSRAGGSKGGGAGVAGSSVNTDYEQFNDAGAMVPSPLVATVAGN